MTEFYKQSWHSGTCDGFRACPYGFDSLLSASSYICFLNFAPPFFCCAPRPSPGARLFRAPRPLRPCAPANPGCRLPLMPPGHLPRRDAGRGLAQAEQYFDSAYAPVAAVHGEPPVPRAPAPIAPPLPADGPERGARGAGGGYGAVLRRALRARRRRAARAAGDATERARAAPATLREQARRRRVAPLVEECRRRVPILAAPLPWPRLCPGRAPVLAAPPARESVASAG